MRNKNVHVDGQKCEYLQVLFVVIVNDSQKEGHEGIDVDDNI